MGAMTSKIISLTSVYSTVSFRRRSKKTSKLRVTGLCAGNSPTTGIFPAQMASNAEKCFHLMTSSCQYLTSGAVIPMIYGTHNRQSSITCTSLICGMVNLWMPCAFHLRKYSESPVTPKLPQICRNVILSVPNMFLATRNWWQNLQTMLHGK